MPASVALAPRSAAAPGAPGVIVPAGTKITVRLIDAVDSTKTAVGERFRASVDDPIVVSDKVVIPRSADALVQLVQAKGSNEIFLKLYSVTVAGKAYDVVSDYAQFKKKSTGRKRARRAIGLGALGAGMQEVDRVVDVLDAFGVTVHRKIDADLPAGDAALDLRRATLRSSADLADARRLFERIEDAVDQRRVFGGGIDHPIVGNAVLLIERPPLHGRRFVLEVRPEAGARG